MTDDLANETLNTALSMYRAYEASGHFKRKEFESLLFDASSIDQTGKIQYIIADYFWTKGENGRAKHSILKSIEAGFEPARIRLAMRTYREKGYFSLDKDTLEDMKRLSSEGYLVARYLYLRNNENFSFWQLPRIFLKFGITNFEIRKRRKKSGFDDTHNWGAEIFS